MRRKFPSFSNSFIALLLFLVFSMLDGARDSTPTLGSSHTGAELDESSDGDETILELLTNRSKHGPHHENITDFQVYKWKQNHRISRLKRISFHKHKLTRMHCFLTECTDRERLHEGNFFFPIISFYFTFWKGIDRFCRLSKTIVKIPP